MTSKPISKHFTKRAKQRAGLNKKTVNTFYNKANECGLTINDFESKTLFFAYLKSITKPKYHVIVYNRYIIICSNEDNVGITLLNLPKEYYSVVDSVKKTKREVYNLDIGKRKRKKRFNDEQRHQNEIDHM